MDTDNILLEHMRAIRGHLARIDNAMDTLRAEMTATRHTVQGMQALQDHDHGDIAAIKLRIDRIEQRLELVDEG